jgi:hypothetical protein
VAALVLCLALQETRVTLESRDVDFFEAGQRALAPFGDSAAWLESILEGPRDLRRGDLSLNDAGYFEVLDRLERLGGVIWLDSRLHPPLIPAGEEGRLRRLWEIPLSESLRLVVYVDRGLAGPNLILLIFFPPTSTPPSFQARASVNGIPIELLPGARACSPRQGGYARFDAPFRLKAYARLRMEGNVVECGSAGAARRFPFATTESRVLPYPLRPSRLVMGDPYYELLPEVIAGLVLAGAFAGSWVRHSRA